MSDTPPVTGGTSVPRDASLQLQLSVHGAPTAAAPAAAAGPPPRAAWLTPVTVPILVAIVALIAPVTTAVYAHYQGQLKLDLDRQAQTDERTRLYLERAISQDAGAESRRQVLRFLVIQDSDPDLQAWATAELADLDVQVPTLKAEEQALTTEVNQTRQDVVALTSEAEQLERRLAVVPEPAKVAVKEQLAEVNKQIDVKRVAEAEKTSRLSRVGVQLRGAAAMRAPVATPTCARRAYFNPTQQPDFGLSAADRLERGRECDQSLAARVPPADAMRSADDQQWLWRLPSGTTCGCTAAT
jgi:outer membrane murein-binding lipoprotein Lpp